MEELRVFLISLIVGGLGGTIVTVFFNARLRSKERKAEAIRIELQKLYGPLYFYTSRNATLFELNDSFQKAYTKEYVEKKWSKTQPTQDRIKKLASTTLEIANEYVRQAIQNNEHIVKILEEQFSLIEPDDVEVYTQFGVDYTRMKTEIDEAGKLKTPFEIFEHLGSISFMRPDFINTIDKRFSEKKAELEKLLK